VTASVFSSVVCGVFVADILKANDEVIRVMALYEHTVHVVMCL